MMNYHNIASHSGPLPLPSLMYVDCPPLPPPQQQQQQQQQQDMHHPQTKKRPNKVHVSAACINCKKAHLACDVSRPCNRCVTTDKADTCRDIQHKKRGRPKMMRDANNNKIRPVSSTATPPTQSMSNNRLIPGPNFDFFPMVPAATSNDMMTVFLSMDLCCARVSDKSLEYLELYPQEFGHRSLYDFLVPGEDRTSLSKLHRCLLDNAVQHQQTRLPHDLLRSSSEKFFSFSLDSLLNIANGSLTLKQKLKFKKGRGDSNADYEEMNCRFYLGGAFGADLFDASTFDQLYIVCIASPIVSAMNINDVIHLPPLMMNNNNDSCSTVSSPVSPPSAMATASATILASSPPPPPAAEASEQSKPDNEGEQDDDMNDDNGGNNSRCSTPTATVSNSSSSGHTQSSSNTIQLPLLPSNPLPFDNDKSKSTLDRFRYNTKTPTQQFIHPNELYYLQTTSSRLSSEAIAHTAYPYLSKTPASAAAVGSGPLANYNSQFKK